MDYTYIKGDRVPGFQVIESWLATITYTVPVPQKTQEPLRNEEARGQYQLPQEKHLNMNIIGLNW